VDADGHEVCFEMAPMPGDAVAWVTLRRGVSPGAAAALLHKLATLLERHGGRLLNLPRGAEGAFDGEGQPEVETFRTATVGRTGDEVRTEVAERQVHTLGSTRAAGRLAGAGGGW
jgi:hypothetical protein